MSTNLAPALSHRLLDALPELCLPRQADSFAATSLVVLNDSLADELGLDTEWLRSDAGLGFLTGARIPDDAEPVAMAYAGHQFGHYSPRLGDGRALLLGELATGGGLVDLHLKGSGRTPFARGGDGRAALGPMLREHLIGEAMHALGTSTGRALAVVTTGEEVYREQALPGALLVRVAASHLRIGTFEYAARLGDADVMRRLLDEAIARHHPHAAGAADPALALLGSVIDVQASLVAQWMLLGFIHGVMNTDNVTISGQTIDYGPCAFMDRHDPATVYSSIDRQGRYAYGNQPPIMQWDLTRLAETLVPLMHGDHEESVDAATRALEGFRTRFEAAWLAGMARKVGLDATTAPTDPTQSQLLRDLPGAMREASADHTGTFRDLADSLREDRGHVAPHPALDAWRERWHEHLPADRSALAAIAAVMDEVNPLYIPRNHLVEEALTKASDGDMAAYEALLDHVTTPFADRGQASAAYAQPAPEAFEQTYQTFCGT